MKYIVEQVTEATVEAMKTYPPEEAETGSWVLSVEPNTGCSRLRDHGIGLRCELATVKKTCRIVFQDNEKVLGVSFTSTQVRARVYS